MTDDEIAARLEFLRAAESLKDTLRSGYTSQGRQESVADHTWRLTLLALTFADLLPGIDLLRLLKICILHDLGEAVDGDIPAPVQEGAPPKSDKERRDFKSLLRPLPDSLQTEYLTLWDEYENAGSPEAKAARGLDKLETILQHNQGKNPAEFDYQYNLQYGRTATDRLALTTRIRQLLDQETEQRMRESGPTGA